MNCPNCQKEVQQTEGKRPKIYCNNTCRVSFFQKKNKKGGIPANYVLKKTHNEIIEKLNARIKLLEAQISSHGSAKVITLKQEETPKNEAAATNSDEIQKKIEELMTAKNNCADTTLGRKMKALYQKQIDNLKKQ